ncbi:MAG: carbohydrate ABC transporter permease [Conexibacter sp.]
MKRPIRSRPLAEPDAPSAGGRMLVTILMLAALGYFMVPLVWVALSATKTDTDLINTFGLWPGPHFALLRNVRELFATSGGIFGRWMLNSAFYTVTSAALAALLSAMAGYVLSKHRFRGRGLLLAITIGAIMVPPQTLVLPTFLMLSKAHMTGTALSVILPMAVSPIGVFLVKTYADAAVPDALLDAARIDGASDTKVFWTIALRLLMPAVVTVFLLAFVANWNNYFLPLVMLSDDHAYPVTVGLANWNQVANAGLKVPYSVVVTGALAAIVPVIAVFAGTQRYWQGGLTTGGVK